MSETANRKMDVDFSSIGNSNHAHLPIHLCGNKTNLLIP